MSRRCSVLLALLASPSVALALDCRFQLDGNGDKHGEVRCTNEKGVLTSLQHWKHGKQDGAWKSWTDDGRLYREEHFREQRQHGPYREWDSRTGHPKEEGHYAFGQKVGEWRTYFSEAPPGRVYTVTTYSEVRGPNESSEPIGDRMYGSDGRLKQQSTRDRSAGTFVSEYYHENGKLRERTESNEKDQTFERRTHDESGKLVRIERMKENHTHGLQEHVGANGQREIECWVRGQRKDSLAACGGKPKLDADGSETIRRYWENGNVREEFRLVDGERDGAYKSFDRKGRLTATVTYRQGKPASGRSIALDDEGRIVGERLFENDALTVERSYYLNGKVREESFREGDRWLLKTYYDNGKLEREVPYRGGGGRYGRRYEGIEKRYDPDGQLVEESEYRNGRLEGTSRRFWNGTLSAKSTYKDGRLVSETLYDAQGRVTASTEYLPDGSRK